MAKVGIVMGSDSDMPIMSKAADMLEKFGIEYEMTIISAHREPDIFFEWAKGAEERGIKVIIAGAGKAAHLPGKNAGILAAQILATSDDALLEKIKNYADEMKSEVVAKDAKLKEVGYKAY